MGMFSCPLSDFSDRQEHRQWYPLCAADGTESSDVGHVLLAFKWVHNPKRISPVDAPVDFGAPAFEAVDSDRDRPPNELRLLLIRAHGLKVMDKNMFSKGGSSDPLVTVQLGDAKQKSTVKKKSLEPEYNEEFKFPAKNGAAVVTFQVDDYDLGSANGEPLRA